MVNQGGPQEAVQTYFVASTGCFSQVKDPGDWVQTRAVTLDGAKRLAARRATGATFTARVAVRGEQGEFRVLATLNNSNAITRRRAIWKTHKA